MACYKRANLPERQDKSFSPEEVVSVCLGKTGPILKRVREGERIGGLNGTSAIHAGADHREAA